MAKVTKEARILSVLRQRSLNRMEATDYGDWVLPATVAALRAKGWAILGTPERIPTRFGCAVRVMRYDLIAQL